MSGAPVAQAPVRKGSIEDAMMAADILADAFSDDPVMNWTFGGNKAFRTTFLELARGIYLRRGFCHIIGDDAATLWLPPGEAVALPLMNELRIAFKAVSATGFGVVNRVKKVSGVMEKAHPHKPHLYLFAVGVRKRAQGSGLGGRLIREGLAQARGADAYLENSNPKNTPLYERLGFRAIAPLNLPQGAPPLLGMWREGGA